MIEISDKSKCTGCGACIAACPKHIIAFLEDDEGTRYPSVDKTQCIHCNRCETVCPMKASSYGVPEENIIAVRKHYAAQLKDKSELDTVSSGGVFWAIAKTVFDENGIVYGAVQTEIDRVVHSRATDLDEAKSFRRSKYIQSDISDSYDSIKKDLETGRTVLFSGTGCQIGGLNMFLGKRYDNLVTCEVVCHGVPSGLAWKSFLEEKQKKEKKQITGLIFRDKSKGWSNNQYRITYADGTEEYERSTEQLFHSGYLKGLFYRPSCGSCPFAHLPRTADITLADFWRYEGKLTENGDIGVSLAVINNSKGEAAFGLSEKYLDVEATDAETALESCRHLSRHPEENHNREAFMKALKKDGYYKAYSKFAKDPNIFIKGIVKLKRFMRKWVKNSRI